ncbi:HOG (high osmolarity glycerol) pathway protein [Rhizina undulata]
MTTAVTSATTTSMEPVPCSSPAASQNLTSRSLLAASPTSLASKRLSTNSLPPNSSPNPQAPISSPSSPPQAVLTASPSSSPTPSNPNSPPTKHRIPSFPSPQDHRISIMSTISSQRGSFIPQFVSSLSYTNVRDFAYPSLHPLHYGPHISSAITTPADSQRSSQYFESANSGSWFTGGGSGFRRLSDPAHSSFEVAGSGWGDSSLSKQRSTNQPPPPLNLSDGPPWSEDEDLQSPVVVSKHRKHKSSAAHLQMTHSRGQSKNAVTPTTQNYDFEPDTDWSGRRKSAIENGNSPGGNYYTTRSGRRTDIGDGEPGGILYRHDEEQAFSEIEAEEYEAGTQFYNTNPANYVYASSEEGHEYDDEDGEEEDIDDEDNRLSRDYQFTIASPDEEMHGKAVALFDFIRENENELPLVEGQVVWVSYRHGMGWLVAEDPKTGESGLIPEEYVRLLRDLHSYSPQRIPSSSNSSSHNPPKISTFSTSSQDLNPYPYEFHYPSDHAPASPLLRPQTPEVEGEPQTAERILHLQREQERAVAEEAETPKASRTGKFKVLKGSPEESEQEFWDAREEISDSIAESSSLGLGGGVRKVGAKGKEV